MRFAFDTISKRVPGIAESMLKYDWPQEVKSNLSALAREIRADAPLREVQDLPRCDAHYWNGKIAALPESANTWWSVGVWVAENYFYKRILEIFEVAGVAADPFAPQKSKQLEDVANVLPAMEKDGSLRDLTLSTWLVRSLWGNVADLSLSGGKLGASVAVSGIICDETAAAVKSIEAASRVGLVPINYFSK